MQLGLAIRRRGKFGWDVIKAARERLKELLGGVLIGILSLLGWRLNLLSLPFALVLVGVVVLHALGEGAYRVSVAQGAALKKAREECDVMQGERDEAKDALVQRINVAKTVEALERLRTEGSELGKDLRYAQMPLMSGTARLSDTEVKERFEGWQAAVWEAVERGPLDLAVQYHGAVTVPPAPPSRGLGQADRIKRDAGLAYDRAALGAAHVESIPGQLERLLKLHLEALQVVIEGLPSSLAPDRIIELVEREVRVQGVGG